MAGQGVATPLKPMLWLSSYPSWALLSWLGSTGP